MALSRDGKTAVTCGRDKTAVVWDAVTGAKTATLTDFETRVKGVSVTDDGSAVLASDSVKHYLWERAACKARLLDLGRNLFRVELSRDGGRVAFAEGTDIRVWDVKAGKRLPVQFGSAGAALHCNWSPKGTHLFVGTDDRAAVVVGTDGTFTPLEGHAGVPRTSGWTAAGDRLLTGDHGDHAALWAPAAGKLLAKFRTDRGGVKRAALTADGAAVATADGGGKVTVYDADQPDKPRLSIPADQFAVDELAWSPDASRLLTATRNSLRVFDAKTGEHKLAMDAQVNSVTAAAWSPDGTRVAAGYSSANRGVVSVWDVAAGKLLLSSEAQFGDVTCLCWSPDAEFVATGSRDHTIAVRDAKTGAVRQTLAGHAAAVTSVSWHPNGRWIASTSEDRTTRIWDAPAGKELCRLVFFNGGKDRLVLTPGGEFDATDAAKGVPVYLRPGTHLAVPPEGYLKKPVPGLPKTLLGAPPAAAAKWPEPKADPRPKPPAVPAPGVETTYWKLATDPAHDPVHLSNTQFEYARWLSGSGRPAEALALLEPLLERERAAGRFGDHSTRFTIAEYARTAAQAGRHDKAVAVHEEALAADVEQYGERSAFTAGTRRQLAAACIDARKFDRAIELHVRAAQLSRTAAEKFHPLMQLMDLYRRQGKADRQIATGEAILELAKGADPRTAGGAETQTRVALAKAYARAGKRDEARRTIEPVVAGVKKAEGPVGIYLKTSIAQDLVQMGEADAGLELYRDVLAEQTKKNGPDHTDTLAAAASLGWGYHLAGKYDKAAEQFKATHATLKEKFGADAVATRDALANLALALEEGKKPADAEPLRREHLALQIKAGGGPDAPVATAALAFLGLHLLKQEKWADAEQALRECLGARQKKAPNDWTTFNTMSLVGAALLGQKKYSEAEELLVGGLDGLRARRVSIPEGASARYAEAIERVIRLYEATDRKMKAGDLQTELEAWQSP